MHRYGALSFTDVIVKSSNVGAIKIGARVGAERMGLYVRRFGFGRPTSPDFPGESPGIVWIPNLNDSALASVSMGYQVGVTPLQMVTAVSAVANGGTLFEPRVVSAVTRDGVRSVVQPNPVRTVIKPETAATLTTIMEQVVERGTGDPRQDRRLHDRRQDRDRRQAGQRPLLEYAAERVVRRLRAVPQPAPGGDRDDRLAARRRGHRRRGRGADLQADRRGRAAAPRRAAERQPGAAGARRSRARRGPSRPAAGAAGAAGGHRRTTASAVLPDLRG